MKITSVPVLFFVLMAGSEVMSADLWFREDFAETPPEIPVQQKHLANPELILTARGTGYLFQRIIDGATGEGA